MTPDPGLLRELLVSARPLRPSRPNAPDIWFSKWADRPALVKSYHHCSALYRQSVGRVAMNREWWALQRLAGTGTAPLPMARPLPWVVVMEWIEGTPLESLHHGQFSASKLLAEAERLLQSLAKAGVVHGDIGHDYWSTQGRESNLLLAPGCRLVAIDFAGCWAAPPEPRPWHRLGQALQLHDQLLLTKILYHLGDDSVADHPGWRLPSQRSVAWWDLMKLLGKI